MLDLAFVEKLSHRETDICAHLLTLYNFVIKQNSGVVVEVGAGQSTYALTAAVNQTGGHFWSIDNNAIAHLRGFPEGEGILENEEKYTRIISDDIIIAKVWDRPIDFLFIDSSHTYQHTKDELNLWTKYIYKGGIVAMHDVSHTAHHINECQKALDEYLAENPGIWGVQEWDNCQGLTVLTKLK